MVEEDFEIYRAHVYCANCGWVGEVELPKGFPVLQAECENCSCRTLRLPKVMFGFRGRQKGNEEAS